MNDRTTRVRKFLLPIILTGQILIVPVIFNSCFRKGIDRDQKDNFTNLRDAYEDYFTIGTALSTRTLDDSMAIVRVKEQFNSITAENSMKWEKIHPDPGIYNFTNSDRFVEFGVENHMEIVGHVLVWHSQTPGWVFRDADGNLTSRDTLLSRMRDHIQTVMGRYKDRIKIWDVVNEAIDDNAQFRQNIWAQIVGEDYVQKAFEYARDVDPEAVLIYNDYSLPTPAKRDAVVKLVSGLKEKGVKVDAIGLQAHYHLDYPELSELEQAIIAFSKIGCKVHITELDINVLPNPFEENAGADVRLNFKYDAKWNPWPDSLPDSMQTVLADRYVSFFEIFMRHRDVVDRVTFWGVQDGTSWLNFWPIFGRTNYPLLFDRNYQPKKAFRALLELPEEQNDKERIK